MMQPRCEEGKRLMQKQDFFCLYFVALLWNPPNPPQYLSSPTTKICYPLAQDLNKATLSFHRGKTVGNI